MIIFSAETETDHATARCSHRLSTVANEGESSMSKNHDAKKNVKKAPTRTPQEKREAKRIKKAEKSR